MKRSMYYCPTWVEESAMRRRDRAREKARENALIALACIAFHIAFFVLVILWFECKI